MRRIPGFDLGRAQGSTCSFITFWALVSILGGLGCFQASGKTILDAPLVLTQVPRSTCAPLGNGGGEEVARVEWFEGARIVVVYREGQVRVISEGFHSACDPSLSFDAKRIVFAGKKLPQSHWRIYEIGLDGGNLRPVSPEDQEARSPVYATTLFTLDSPEPWFTIVYAVREKTQNEVGGTDVSSLYSIKLDGTESHRLTFNPNLSFDPFQMWDGRLLYAAERYPNQPAAQAGQVRLHTINIEGTEMVFYGGEGGQRLQHMPCATESNLVVFVEADQYAWDGAGQLGSIRECRPHHTYKPLTRDPAFVYLYPSAWRGNLLLVSRRPKDGGSTSGVYCFDSDKGECELVFDTPDFHEVQAKIARPRRQPDGRSTVVDPAHFTTGIFYAQNCSDADERMRPHLAPGAFKRVRVIEGLPVAANEAVSTAASALSPGSETKGPFVARRLLGEAPVEADGSFQIEVPADTPVLLQTLDERGLALGTCGWVWVKPRETRGCIGCHEDPELMPENNFVFAMRRRANKLNPPLEQRRAVDFRNTIAPILKNRCASVGCHGMPDSPLHLPLGADQPALRDLQQAYATLRTALEGGGGTPNPLPQRGKYVDAGRARTSPLIWRLFGADTSRPWDRDSRSAPVRAQEVKLMPPPEQGGRLSEEEIRAFVEWIDLGAAWETAQPNEAGAPMGVQKSRAK